MYFFALLTIDINSMIPSYLTQSGWPAIAQGENGKLLHRENVNKIGNFTLLGQKLNIIASNNPFKDKLVQYKKSSLKITQEIVKNYNDYRFDQVFKRSEFLAEKAIKIWKIN